MSKAGKEVYMDTQKINRKLIIIPGVLFKIEFKFLKYVRKLIDIIRGVFAGSLNFMLLILCVVSISLDSLFFYIPAIDYANKCLVVDEALSTATVVLRWIVDCIYLIHVIYRLRVDFFIPWSRSSKKGTISKEAWQIARKYLPRFFLVDLPAILPIPQMVVSFVFPRLRSTDFLEAMILLKSFVLSQYVPRALRMHGLFGVFSRDSGILSEAAPIKALINLSLYLLASHVAGALCSGNFTFIDNYCPTQTPDATHFDFGMFLEALQSGIAKEATGFPQKFLYCFLWGLQNLSCFGQNLHTSTYFWENLFAVFIVISGLVLFVSLIGNMQIYIQSKTIRNEEMRLKGREIEHWTPFKKLPEDLKEQVMKYQRYKWQETRGIDVENILNYLPKDLRRSIKRELCIKLLKKVKEIEKMGVVVLDALCDRVSPALYIERNHIIQEGDAIDQMLFIVQGKLWTYVSGRVSRFSGLSDVREDGNDQMNKKDHLEDGDFCGEELLPWAMEESPPPVLPISPRTIQAVTKVEAFVLLANDLKNVLAQYRRRRTKAAGRIQSVWRSRRQKTYVPLRINVE